MSKVTKEKLLKFENMKLKNQLIFTLPATKEVCGRECPGCYAIKAQKRFPKTVPNYRQRMLEASKSEDFVERIIAEIQDFVKRKPVKAVRLHESGEFYSQEYIDKWEEIAKRCEDIKFYTFTKRKKDFDFSNIESLDNFVLIDSLKFKGLNYGSYDEMMELVHKHGAKICPVTLPKSGVVCGVSCSYCWHKSAQIHGTVFVKH